MPDLVQNTSTCAQYNFKFHHRVPLSPDIKEVLEVAYTSKIMSKNFRKEGQPEKERLAQITGIELDKVNISEVITSLNYINLDPGMV